MRKMFKWAAFTVAMAAAGVVVFVPGAAGQVGEVVIGASNAVAGVFVDHVLTAFGVG